MGVDVGVEWRAWTKAMPCKTGGDGEQLGSQGRRSRAPWSCGHEQIVRLETPVPERADKDEGRARNGGGGSEEGGGAGG